MTRKARIEQQSGYTILVTDDDEDYVEVTRRLLEREGHKVMTARSGASAIELLRTERVDLLLLDYYMPGMTGEQVVTEVRRFNPYVQIILQTGYASEQPPRDLLRRLDIQGYYDKSEGPDKLLLWTDVGLKAAYMIQLLNKSRQGLRYILDVTPDMHKIQSLSDLLQGILLQVAGLLGATHSFLALLPEDGVVRKGIVSEGAESFIAMVDDEAELIIRASTGHFTASRSISEYLSADKMGLVKQVVTSGEIRIQQSSTIVPLRISDTTLGIVYLDRAAVLEQDIELLRIFANQASVAIQNAQLYEMATLDPTTGTYLRRFFDQWVVRELRGGFRAQQPLALLVVDVDDMKAINDTAGHLAGDQALAMVGKSLRDAVRTSDAVGRYGGDEFAIVLRHTTQAGAERVAERILQFVRDKSITGPEGPIPVHVSIGLSVLNPELPSAVEAHTSIPPEYFRAVLKTLFRCADEGLYEAKRQGGGRLCIGPSTTLPELSAAS